MNPFLLTGLLFLFVGFLVALDASLTHLELLPWFNGLRWLRVHVVTLGVVTESLFGVLPLLVAMRAGRRTPTPRLDIWLLLSSGIVLLIAGIPLVDRALILAGGTLVFVASALLLHHLWGLRRGAPRAGLDGESDGGSDGVGRRFYLTGAAFLLLGALVGTGLWLGWNEVLRMAAPIEVHIHSNSWGFLSLVFAGVLLDQYRGFAGRELAWPGTIAWIYWLMTLGAIGLVLGPWLALTALTASGMILHLSATLLLLLNLFWPVRDERASWTPGMVHVFAAYLWIVVPLLFAPFILRGVESFPTAAVEGNAPQALVYGWALQLTFALTPYLFARYVVGLQGARLFGTWFSVLMVNTGSLLLLVGIFAEPQRSSLHALAYLAWTLSMIPILAELLRISRRALEAPEPTP